jgi:predicted nuclease with TOPRIM domain
MKKTKLVALACIAASLAATAGCGIPKEKYEALLNEKIVLEEKANVLLRAKDALKKEYDDLLGEKMTLSAKLDTAVSEKAALKGEYDKILDEKITVKAAYDKLLAENRDLQDRLGRQ